ncbi:MAG: prephenate dehydratase [Vulcanibacillus sp.]
MIRIGFLGPKGTFSHEAVKEYIKKIKEYEIVESNTIPDLMVSVSEGLLDEAVLPVENSLEGAVTSTLDMFAEDLNITIKAELIIPINLNLLVKENSKREDIKAILSHPQPIGQCRKYTNNNFSNAEIRPVLSTAAAAEEVATGDGTTAAIGSAIAGEIYNLKVLDSNIQDGGNNFTRFVIISKEKSNKTGNDKTSIVFSTDNKPGSLYRILDIFNIWDINMTKIESRPSKEQLGKYIFYVDIIGHQEDDDIKDALSMVRRKTSFLKILGSYPIDIT